MTGTAVQDIGDAVNRWVTANIPSPRIALVAPSRIDAIIADFKSRATVGVFDRSKGINVLGMEVAPDRRVDPGIVVFVDENFKFVGATKLP